MTPLHPSQHSHVGNPSFAALLLPEVDGRTHACLSFPACKSGAISAPLCAGTRTSVGPHVGKGLIRCFPRNNP